MKNLYQKTIVFLNLRFSDFYSKELFKKIKENQHIRMVAIVDQQFKNRIGETIRPYLDQIIFLPAQPKDGFLAEFNYEQITEIIKPELLKTHDLRIVCADEFNLLNAGRLRREYKLDGHTDHDLLLYRNKVKMKEILRKAKIRVPSFRILQRSDHFQKIAEDIGLPFIIKPVDSCGSHGVYMIRTENDFKKFQHEAGQYQGMEVEEYIEGDLYHVDSCIKDHELTFICANEYTCPNHEFTKGKALGSIPLNDSHPHKIRLINFAKKVLKTFNANNLVCHMEIFINRNDDLIFLEVSARPPGALICLSHKINFGINFIDEDFFIQTDMDIVLEKFKSPCEKAFWALFPLQAGKIVRLIQPSVNSLVDLTWHVKQGDYIKEQDCKNIVNKAANAIFYHNDSEILRDDFESIKRYQAIEVSR